MLVTVIRYARTSIYACGQDDALYTEKLWFSDVTWPCVLVIRTDFHFHFGKCSRVWYCLSSWNLGSAANCHPVADFHPYKVCDTLGENQSCQLLSTMRPVIANDNQSFVKILAIIVPCPTPLSIRGMVQPSRNLELSGCGVNGSATIWIDNPITFFYWRSAWR